MVITKWHWEYLMSEIRDIDICKLILENVYIRNTGYLESIKAHKPINADGHYIPWFTYPAIDLLNNRLVDSTSRLFEWGLGYGTLYFAKMVAKIISCEHNAQWLNKMAPLLPPNVHPIYHKLEAGGEYSKSIHRFPAQYFDIIIIDGRDRVNCALNCLNHLSPKGIIIWDNSERKHYLSGKEFLKDSGYKELQLFGLTPAVLHTNSTSFFYREGNILGL